MSSSRIEYWKAQMKKALPLWKIFFVELLSFMREIIKIENVKDPNKLVDVLHKWIRKVDMGGVEIYYMFIGGIAFIVFSHLFSMFISPIINNYLFPIWIFDAFWKLLAQITLLIVFIWFILAFMMFIWVLFFQKNAWQQTLAARKAHQQRTKSD
eukprot:282675_1